MKKTIILASGNKGKINEVKEIFKDYNVLSLKEVEELLNKTIIIEENKETFEENALEKAHDLYRQVGEEYLCIADDTGISIDGLDGFPGVYTNRWMDADDHTKNIELIKKMKNNKNRGIHYTNAVALVGKDIEKVSVDTLDGIMTEECRGTNGFGFDEIFELPNGKTLAEINLEEKLKISPRKKALEKLKN